MMRIYERYNDIRNRTDETGGTDEPHSPLAFIHRWTPEPGIPNQMSINSLSLAIESGHVESFDSGVLNLTFPNVGNIGYELEIDANRGLIIRYTIIAVKGENSKFFATTYKHTYDNLDRLTSTSMEWHNTCGNEPKVVHRNIFIHKYAPDGSYITKGPY